MRRLTSSLFLLPNCVRNLRFADVSGKALQVTLRTTYINKDNVSKRVPYFVRWKKGPNKGKRRKFIVRHRRNDRNQTDAKRRYKDEILKGGVNEEQRSEIVGLVCNRNKEQKRKESERQHERVTDRMALGLDADVDGSSDDDDGGGGNAEAAQRSLIWFAQPTSSEFYTPQVIRSLDVAVQARFDAMFVAALT